MEKTKRNPDIDTYLNEPIKWQQEFRQLREIILEFPFNETMKWGHPCYSIDQKNILLIHGFKDYCAILFFKGSLLNNDSGLLIQQTKNVQAARQIRFRNVQEILDWKETIKTIIQDAIDVEKSGLTITFKKPEDFPVPEELVAMFEDDPKFKNAFDTLSPGRQRAYLLYFAQPKFPKTREARIGKYLERILEGKGLND